MLHIRYPLDLHNAWSVHAAAHRATGRPARTQPTPTAVLTLSGTTPGLRLPSRPTTVHSTAEIQE